MTCNTRSRNVITAPALDQFVSSFFNTAIGDVLQTPTSKKHVTRPSTNVIKLEDKFILEVALPGFSKADVTVSIEEDILTISDNREAKKEENAISYRLREFNYAGFSKSFRLPEEVDTDKVTASFDNGVLSISLDKKEEALPVAPRTVEIK